MSSLFLEKVTSRELTSEKEIIIFYFKSEKDVQVVRNVTK